MSIDMVRFNAIFRMLSGQPGEREAAFARLTTILEQHGLAWSDITIDLPDRVKRNTFAKGDPSAGGAPIGTPVFGKPVDNQEVRGLLSVVSQRRVGIAGIVVTMDLQADDGLIYRFCTSDRELIRLAAARPHEKMKVAFSLEDGAFWGYRSKAFASNDVNI